MKGQSDSVTDAANVWMPLRESSCLNRQAGCINMMADEQRKLRHFARPPDSTVTVWPWVQEHIRPESYSFPAPEVQVCKSSVSHSDIILLRYSEFECLGPRRAAS